MTVQLAPTPIFKAFDNNGNPLANGQLFSYIAGTSTPQATWVDSTQTTQNTNPISLNARGEGSVWLDQTLTYKLILKDSLGNQIWSQDNINGGYLTPSLLAAILTQSYIGAIIYPQTLAENLAAVVPTNYIYPPGALRRYGADPTGIVDSAPALTSAIQSNDVVFDDYPGGGTYLFNSSIILNSVLRISGATKTVTGTTTRGTTFICGTLPANSRFLHATAFVSDVVIENITFTFQNNTQGQTAIYFDVDCRSSRIRDCAFMGGTPTSSTNVAAIGFGGGGTFTGDVTIERCYFANLQLGVGLSGTCTTVRIISNEFYTNAVIPGSNGINNQSSTGGVVIAFNTFQAWVKAINAPNGVTRQLYNYFEGNGTFDFDWGSSSFNVEIGSTSTVAPLSNYLYNNSSGNVVLGLYGTALDSSVMKAWRGFAEQNRAVANGHQQTRSFAAGNYTGGGGWTVTSGQVQADMLVVDGNHATYYFEVISSTVTGGNATLTIALPGGVTANARSTTTCRISDNGTAGIGVCEVLNAGTAVNIYKDATLSANWSASTTNTTVQGQISFPIAFSVN